MYPSLFGINSLSTYVIMMALGIFAMFIYASKKLDIYYYNEKKRTDRMLFIILISLGFALLFSYIFDAVFHYIKEGVFKLEGITFLGGLFGGVSAFVGIVCIFLKEERKDILNIINIIIPSVALAHAFGRIGCFLGGCCYGAETNFFLGVKFPGETISRHPTQLYEAFFLLVLFLVLDNIKKERLSIYLLSYGVFRFAIEFLRADNRGSIIPDLAFPSPSQLLSLVLVFVAIGLILIKYLKRIKGSCKKLC